MLFLTGKEVKKPPSDCNRYDVVFLRLGFLLARSLAKMYPHLGIHITQTAPPFLKSCHRLKNKDG